MIFWPKCRSTACRWALRLTPEYSRKCRLSATLPFPPLPETFRPARKRPFVHFARLAWNAASSRRSRSPRLTGKVAAAPWRVTEYRAEDLNPARNSQCGLEQLLRILLFLRWLLLLIRNGGTGESIVQSNQPAKVIELRAAGRKRSAAVRSQSRAARQVWRTVSRAPKYRSQR